MFRGPTEFNGDVSESEFNGDVSNWDVSSVTDMGVSYQSSQYLL